MTDTTAILLIVGASFVACGLGAVASARIAAEFMTAYRLYFDNTIGPGLKKNFILTDLSIVFFSSLAVTAGLGVAGFVILGSPGAVCGLVGGLCLPHFALLRLRRRRADQFIFQLPDALHALSATLRAGVNLPKGLEQLASWQPAPLSQEFGLVLSEYQIGRDLSDALDNMHRRIERPELEILNSAINVSRTVGGNLADTVESLAFTLQEKATVEGKINALTAMGKIQGWVVSFIPLAIGAAMFALDPSRMYPLFTEVSGWITLAIVAVMMLMAVIVIRKIVNIDV